jgi:hypothetical protein
LYFFCCLLEEWPPQAVVWLRELGGKLGSQQDQDGAYMFVQGLAAFYQTWLTFSFVLITPFPHTLLLSVRNVCNHQNYLS